MGIRLGCKVAGHPELEVLRVLLDHGANVNAKMQNYWTQTRIHLSAANGYLEIVKLLLDFLCPIKPLAFLETALDMATRPQNHEFPGGLGVRICLQVGDVLPRNSTTDSIQIPGTDRLSFGISDHSVLRYDIW